MDNLVWTIVKIAFKYFLYYVALGTVLCLIFAATQSLTGVIVLAVVYAVMFIVLVVLCLREIKEAIEAHNYWVDKREKQREEEERRRRFEDSKDWDGA